MGFWQPLFFWIFAFGAVASSIAVLLFRNPLYSALSLIADFVFFAGLYVLLSGHAIAVVQILVYTGAIMVLFVFIIMLLNLGEADFGPRRFSPHHIIALASGVGLFGMITVSILQVTEPDNKKTRQQDVYQSQVNGLYAKLTEKKLQSLYRDKINRWIRGDSTPATGKYEPYNGHGETANFEVPPALHKDDVEGAARKDEGLFGTIEPLSILLIGRFVIPFELTAILLLAAIVGAVIIAKKRL